MGKEAKFIFENASADVLTKQFWRDNERFADLFNACFFDGEQKIKPEELTEMDTEVSYSILSKEIQKMLKRTRDVVKMSSDGICYRILGIEDQQKVHYAMPLRCMIYDALNYLRQVDEISKNRKKKKEYDGAEEFLSGIGKPDKLVPCYTIVVYWGEFPWDGPRTLKDMMDFGKEEASMLFFSDYSMNLVCVNEENTSKIRNKDVRDLFDTVQVLYQKGGRDIPEKLRDIRLDIAYAAAAITGTLKEFRNVFEEEARKGKEFCDMCEAAKKAFAEERQVGRAEGLAEGKAEGRAEGRAEGKAEATFETLYTLVQDKLLSPEEAAKRLNLTVEALFEEGKAKFG